jgi:site-specific DNA recombinase
MDRTAVYLRISQDREAEGLGVDRQREDCAKLLADRGWDAVEFVDNDVSATSRRKRPAWTAMLDALRSGEVRRVVSWANDRLYRKAKDQLELLEAVKDAGGVIATVKDGEVDPRTASGRMTMGILANVAEFETARKSERQLAKAKQMAQAGRANGGGPRPFGYEAGGVQVNVSEADLIREATRRILDGDSVYGIVRDWNERGIPTSTGKTWSSPQLARTLRLPRLAGLRVHHGQTYPAEWPSILDETTWGLLQRRLSPTTRKTGRRPSYLLTGVIACGRCGRPMHGHPTGVGKRSYACIGELGGCGGMRIIADPTEAVVAEALFDAVDGGVLAKVLAAASADAASAETLEVIAADRASLEELSTDYYVERAISKSEFTKARDALARRIEQVEASLARSEQTAALAGMSSGTAARTAWEGWGTSRRRELVAALIERIEIAPSRVYRFDPERIGIVWRA